MSNTGIAQEIKQDSIEIKVEALKAFEPDKVFETQHAKKHAIEDRCSFLTLNNLARAAESLDNNKAFECLYIFLAVQNERKQFFENLLEKESNSRALETNPGKFSTWRTGIIQ